MSDDVVGFSFLAESDIPVWYLKAGETIFKEGKRRRSFTSSRADGSKSSSAIACSPPSRPMIFSAKWH
jgi:hypothetical protein